MRIERTRDLALVRSVLTHASQLRMSADDATDVATWTPHDDERVWYLEARHTGELLGIFTLIPRNAVCYEIHAALLPIAWGSTRPVIEGAFAFAFRETPARRIVASIPAHNRLAIALAKRAGMIQFGLNPASFLRDGALNDQVLLGISEVVA